MCSELNEVSLNWFDRCVYIGITLSVFDTWLGRRLNIQRWCSSILYYRNPFGIASFNGHMYVSEWVSVCACARAHLPSLNHYASLSRSFLFAHTLIRFGIHCLYDFVYQTSILSLLKRMFDACCQNDKQMFFGTLSNSSQNTDTTKRLQIISNNIEF